jgi:glycosyltransferase involved in cell wall biosynthesis
MNIAVVNDFASVNGGASKIAIGSAKALAEAGETVFLVTAVGPVAPQLRATEGLTILCSEQCEIIADRNRTRAAIQGLWNFKASRLLQNLLDRLAPADTIVHIHMWAKALSSSVIRSAVKRGFKVAVTLHDFQAVCPNGILYNHQKQQICELQPMSMGCIATNCDSRVYPHKLWRVARQAVQRVAGCFPSGADAFISISELSENVMRKGLPAGVPFYRVGNFVDAAQEAPVDVRANSDFVYAGRLAAEKGVRLWAECARGLGLKGLFIGDGDLRDELRERYGQTNITGWLSSSETRIHLRRARALVFPSLWYETQGLVVAEAAAMGVPCIVADTCAAREWVANGKTGLWFRGGDGIDLARQVTRLQESPEFAATLGLEAFRTYWDRPASIEKHVEDLQTAYRAILKPRPISERQALTAELGGDSW